MALTKGLSLCLLHVATAKLFRGNPGGLGNPLGAIVGGYIIAFSEVIITYAFKSSSLSVA